MLLSTEKLDNALMAAKDAMRERLNGHYDDEGNVIVADFLTAVEEVLQLLEFNFDIWCSCDYAYKGREIANEINNRLWRLQCEITNRRRLDRIGRLRGVARDLAERYFVEEHL